MSVDFILDYKPLDLAMVLLPVFVLLAIVEITAVYYLKIKNMNNTSYLNKYTKLVSNASSGCITNY